MLVQVTTSPRKYLNYKKSEVEEGGVGSQRIQGNESTKVSHRAARFIVSFHRAYVDYLGLLDRNILNGNRGRAR